MSLGIDTADIHLDLVDWAQFSNWTDHHYPRFAGRYFLGEPGTYLWAAAEGSETVFDNNGTFDFVAPIQAPLGIRLETSGDDGFFYGQTDAEAMCRRVDAYIAMGELAFPEPSGLVAVYLRVDPGIQLTPDYWAGWADGVYNHSSFRQDKKPYLPCIMCNFDVGVDGKHYVLDKDVKACLDIASSTFPGNLTRCYAFWAMPTDATENWTPPDGLDWSLFMPLYAQPSVQPLPPGAVNPPTAYSIPVPVALWRFAQKKIAVADPHDPEFTTNPAKLASDPDFAAGRPVGIDTDDSNVSAGATQLMLQLQNNWRLVENVPNTAGYAYVRGQDTGVQLTPASAAQIAISTLDNIAVSYVGRYYTSTPGSLKLLQPAEVGTIHGAGLKVFVFYEGLYNSSVLPAGMQGNLQWPEPPDCRTYFANLVGSQPWPGSNIARQGGQWQLNSQGFDDASWACTHAANNAQPPYSAIYFAIDFGADVRGANNPHTDLDDVFDTDHVIHCGNQAVHLLGVHKMRYWDRCLPAGQQSPARNVPSDRDLIINYFDGILAGYTNYIATHPEYPYILGVYGSAPVLQWCYQRGVTNYFCQASARGWFQNNPLWHHDNMCQLVRNVAGVNVDFDRSWGDEGAW